MRNLLIRFGREPRDIIRESIRFTVAVLLIGTLVNVSSMFLMSVFIISALYTALTYRNGILFSIASMIIASVALFAAGFAGDIVVVMGSLGILVGELYYRRKSMLLAIMAAAVMLVFVNVLSIRAASKSIGSDVIEYQFNLLAKTMQEQAGVNDMINYNIEQAKTMMRMFFPAILLIYGLGLGVLNYFFAGSIVNRMDLSKRDFRSFGEFRLPGSAMMAFLITLVGIYLVSKLMGYSIEMLNYNLLAIYFFLFLLQGLAVCDRMVFKSRQSIFRNVVLLTLVLTVFLYPFFVTIGALDSIFNIRKLPR